MASQNETTTTDTNNRWGFAVGKPFATATADSPEDWLHTALAAERFIRRFQHEDQNGIYWESVEGGKPSASYADGCSGIMYFYIALAEVTGNAGFRETAYQSARWILAHWDDPSTSDDSPLEGFDACVGNMLLEAFKAFGDQAYVDAALTLAQRYVDSCSWDEHGPYWTGNTAWAKDGGIILFLLNAGLILKNQLRNQSDGLQSLLGFVAQAGRQYLAEGKRDEQTGRLVFDGKLGGTFTVESIVFHLDYNMPNWEFGAAGSGYILLKLYELTGQQEYLRAAENQVDYLRSVAVPQSKGVLIARTLELGDDTYYIGHCQGMAGTGKFLYEMYRLTGNQDAYRLIVDLADGAEAVGAPEHMSKGLWNITTLCCGHAGIAHYFIGLYLADGNERWRQLAIRCGNVLLGMKEDNEDGSSDWPIAFWRIKPNEITRPHSLFRGAAGIGTALLELYMMERGDYTWNRLIDDPFPSRWIRRM